MPVGAFFVWNIRLWRVRMLDLQQYSTPLDIIVQCESHGAASSHAKFEKFCG